MNETREELEELADKALAAFTRSDEKVHHLHRLMEKATKYEFGRVTVRRSRNRMDWEVVYPPQREWLNGLDMNLACNWQDDPEFHDHAAPVIETKGRLVSALYRAEEIQAQIDAVR